MGLLKVIEEDLVPLFYVLNLQGFGNLAGGKAKFVIQFQY
jgi:hypothetical protein